MDVAHQMSWKQGSDTSPLDKQFYTAKKFTSEAEFIREMELELGRVKLSINLILPLFIKKIS
jgi:hypothetical protein